MTRQGNPQSRGITLCITLICHQFGSLIQKLMSNWLFFDQHRWPSGSGGEGASLFAKNNRESQETYSDSRCTAH
jgi:hypothetical protein